ncbi:MAG: aminotransferase class I/II-fold pyridoxal phosphate-dependent enzyme [Saprospiraceae bacterium]|nr:aminotransferase class I/II-fold pyridoxal phosphate-dependent enzyme [Saprospiraceae bacterium]
MNSRLFDSKLPLSGISVFARMTELANRYSAVNLAQGFPDFSPPVQLFDYLNEGVQKGFNQYAPMPGLLQLREEISNRLKNTYQHDSDPETEITVTAGATQAIYTIVSSIIRHGDKAILFEPAYDSYAPSIIANGGIPVYLRLNEPSFDIPWDELEATLAKEKIKLIIINNPHNPCGTILSKDNVNRLYTMAEQYNCILIWDEVYDLLVYDNNTHHSGLEHELMLKRGIVVYSMGKTLHNTGWKIGYVIANSYITSEIRKLHQFTVFSVNTPAQYASAMFLKNHFDFFKKLSEFYQTKRDFFVKNLTKCGLEILPASGSYFILARYNFDKSISDESFAQRLAQYCQVACIPISAFYHDRYDSRIVRFCFAKKEETLQIACERLNNSIDKIQISK